MKKGQPKPANSLQKSTISLPNPANYYREYYQRLTTDIFKKLFFHFLSQLTVKHF